MPQHTRAQAHLTDAPTDTHTSGARSYGYFYHWFRIKPRCSGKERRRLPATKRLPVGMAGPSRLIVSPIWGCHGDSTRDTPHGGIVPHSANFRHSTRDRRLGRGTVPRQSALVRYPVLSFRPLLVWYPRISADVRRVPVLPDRHPELPARAEKINFRSWRELESRAKSFRTYARQTNRQTDSEMTQFCVSEARNAFPYI